MASKKKHIRITACNKNPQAWYAKRIGEEFELVSVWEAYFLVKKDIGKKPPILYEIVRKDDAIIIEETK